MGVVIRCANIHDPGPITKIFVESWQSTYAGILPKKILINLSKYSPKKTFWRSIIDNSSPQKILLVAKDSDAGVVGFVSGGKPRIENLGIKSEIYELYLLESFQGLGIGRLLFSKAAKKLQLMFGISFLVWVVGRILPDIFMKLWVVKSLPSVRKILRALKYNKFVIPGKIQISF